MLYIKTLYSLSDITIIPTSISDIRSRRGCSPYCLSLTGHGLYLPIVTAPMDTVAGEENYKDFQKNGISPIIPRTTPLETRLRLTTEVFCAYGMAETEEEFLKKDYPGSKDFYVLIDIANGHMKAQVDLGKALKSKYRGRVHLMGGNIANPETILEYRDAGFEFLRVGIGGGQGCITSCQSGIHYPMASLLFEISQIPHGNLKIIADGGIRSYSDAIKCLALGADYVMMGNTLAKCLEASGELYTDQWCPNVTREMFGKVDLYKDYHGMSTKEVQAKILGVDLKKNRDSLKTSEGRHEKIKIEYTLEGWKDNFDSYLRSAMSYCGCRVLGEFKEKATCYILSDSSRQKLENK